jgi:hypothetical protein
LPGQSGRATDVHAPGAHTLKGVLLGEHVQVPKSEGSGQLNVASLRVRTGS